MLHWLAIWRIAGATLPRHFRSGDDRQFAFFFEFSARLFSVPAKVEVKCDLDERLAG
jgi:hypothetical protein